ncbi:filamentous hemagglutinin N-terminal domain-containing protein [Yersinia hibernica]|uniref:Filamentous hemagglutinin N-terminal domain-containing protein n=1 Tax=Yersinia hibernica TaxID=2339259 RepID=A0ABX5R6C3_9GAMM|nr:filamentous hemagglutinin N-terminal domain-containing protein [Yersinia hibernica]QAX80894.1 filamentous hemagglutinin N-terminal domain-containing protein [Yersinia hibernica]
MISLCLCSRFNIKNNRTELSYGFIIYIFYSLISFSHAEIIVDKNAPQHQKLGLSSIYIKESQSYCKALNAYCRGANYTTVNIQTPNEQGVSHNKYVKFDVLKGAGYDKVSLNNFLASSATGNPNLITVPAKVILNEVTSNQPTLLNGSLSVAGEKAHVIIANPAGIHCDGCHFSNTDHVTLTSGLPVFSGGYINGYNVTGGVVDIGKAGLVFVDNTNAYLDIFSRSLNVDGEIRADDIFLIIGKHAVSYAPIGGRVNVSSLAGFTSKDEDNIGIDVSHLGGMYANKIFIFSKDGGVKNSGIIHADNKINITSNRFIVNNGKISAEDISLRSLALIDNQQGTIKNIKHSSGVDTNGRLGINIAGRIVDNKKGYIYSNLGRVVIDAKGRFYNAHGVVRTLGSYGVADIKIKSKAFHNFNGVIITTNNISINTDNFKNNQGRVVSAFGAVNLRYKTLEDTTGVLHGGMGVKKTIK